MNKGLLTLIATGLLGATVAFAQQPAAGGGGGGGGRGGMLDEQQRQLFQEAVQKENTNLRALEEKLRVAQKELLEATLATKYDEKVVREKAEAVAKIQVDITMLRAKALATVAPTLKPDQKTQMLESRFAIMMLTSTGGFMDRGGFGAGGAPGDRGGRGGGATPGDRGGRGGGGQGGRGGGGGGGVTR